jgi:hypothetical protein
MPQGVRTHVRAGQSAQRDAAHACAAQPGAAADSACADSSCADSLCACADSSFVGFRAAAHAGIRIAGAASAAVHSCAFSDNAARGGVGPVLGLLAAPQPASVWLQGCSFGEYEAPSDGEVSIETSACGVYSSMEEEPRVWNAEKRRAQTPHWLQLRLSRGSVPSWGAVDGRPFLNEEGEWLSVTAEVRHAPLHVMHRNPMAHNHTRGLARHHRAPLCGARVLSGARARATTGVVSLQAQQQASGLRSVKARPLPEPYLLVAGPARVLTENEPSWYRRHWQKLVIIGAAMGLLLLLCSWAIILRSCLMSNRGDLDGKVRVQVSACVPLCACIRSVSVFVAALGAGGCERACRG